MKLGTDGVLSTYRENSNVANGLLIDPDGRLIACEGQRFEPSGAAIQGISRVTRTDLDTGEIEILADNYKGTPLVGPNDVTIDTQGRLYFTDLAGGAVYRTMRRARSSTFWRSPVSNARTVFRSHLTIPRCTWSKPTEPRAVHA